MVDFVAFNVGLIYFKARLKMVHNNFLAENHLQLRKLILYLFPFDRLIRRYMRSRYAKLRLLLRSNRNSNLAKKPVPHLGGIIYIYI